MTEISGQGAAWLHKDRINGASGNAGGCVHHDTKKELTAWIWDGPAPKPGIIISPISPDTTAYNIGKYDRMRLQYLQEHRPVVWGRHVLSGILPKRRFETGSTCNQRVEMPVPAVARRKGVTRSLKAADRMAWVDRMNSPRKEGLFFCAQTKGWGIPRKQQGCPILVTIIISSF